jgi:hypothetical protein
MLGTSTTKPRAGSADSGEPKHHEEKAPKRAGTSPKPVCIKFPATIGHIEINSRGAKVGLLIPESHLVQISQLMQSKMPDTLLEIVATVKIIKQVKDGKEKNGKRRNRRRERFPYNRGNK